METNIAILIADLSGYTALTETHGAVAAADLIDKYTAIVENCLVGDSRVHERVGDEVMIVCSSPDHLAATAAMILESTAREEYFLQVHGGLHYGQVFQRANRYFGTTINLASRIAAKADAGKVLCSHEFINALSDKSVLNLISKGNQEFKNVNSTKEVFELGVEQKRSFHIDPVCRMLILDTQNAITHPSAAGQYFCSTSCLDMYHHHAQLNLN